MPVSLTIFALMEQPRGMVQTVRNDPNILNTAYVEGLRTLRHTVAGRDSGGCQVLLDPLPR
jgi:hypothetical protein